jgi:MTH538 TIR-like domain (DUF1863)
MSYLWPTPPPIGRRYGVFISHAWDYRADYDGVVNLLKLDPTFSWNNLSVPVEDPLKMNLLLKRSYRTLLRQIDERIYASDCLVVVAGMYFRHRGWIQSEVEAATEFGKPIIAVEPRGSQKFPEDLKPFVNERVGWMSRSIVGAIRKLVR